VTTPSRVRIQPGTPMDENGTVKCTGHGRRCSRLVAGPQSKNPGRAFYTCPLGRDDPNRCKFFKWEDELSQTTGNHDERSRGSPLANNNRQTLGQSPQARFGRPAAATTPNANRVGQLYTPQSDAKDEIDDEIDWEKVDTDEVEREAIASTPGSSQRTDPLNAGAGSAQGTSFQDRLRAAVDDGVKKRKLDEEEQTPRRLGLADGQNPFMTSPTTPRSPPHSVLSPTLASLEQVSEHIQRQERLINAGEQLKQGLRKTIANLQERNRELEARVKDLEAKLGA